MAGKGGGGAWKVAYADFVTAMMAFFMVMWLVSQNQKVKEAVAGYFRNPNSKYPDKSLRPLMNNYYFHELQRRKWSFKPTEDGGRGAAEVADTLQNDALPRRPEQPGHRDPLSGRFRRIG
jgi:hypothetical protein